MEDLNEHSAYCMAEIQKVIMQNNEKTKDEIVAEISIRLEEISRELHRKQAIVLLSCARSIGKSALYAALDEVDTSWHAQEQPLTSKQSMLRGRPDLLKENWRRKGHRR